METTLSIDDDAAAQLERLRRERDGSHKGNASLEDIINEALRHGLREMANPKPRKPFRIQPIDVGDMLIPEIDNVAEVLAMLEDNPCEPR
jgi:ArsR family metal-binding transcriptional regulator